MKKYIFKRCLYMVFTLFIVITITFFLMKAVPGDPLTKMAKNLPEQTKANFYAKYDLDKPVFNQYIKYMGNLVHLDLGESVVYAGRSISETISTTSLVSASVGSIALVIGMTIGIVLGIVAALKKNRWPDYIVMIIAILGITIPVFVLASLFQYIFAVKMKVLPASGWGEARHFILPIIVLGFGPIATYSRYLKSSMLDTLDQDYILTARAKGLSERKIISKHVLKNSIIPVVTIFASSVVGIFTGAFIIERMFSIPGIGFYFIDSVNNNDYTMILGTTIFYAALFIVMQLLVDIVYVIIDPRIKSSIMK